METKNLVVYIREQSGNLTRHVIDGMTQSEHMDYCNIGDATGTDKLVGWPETSVEWHGERIGYGK